MIMDDTFELIYEDEDHWWARQADEPTDDLDFFDSLRVNVTPPF
jgi:hypothetical protein